MHTPSVAENRGRSYALTNQQQFDPFAFKTGLPDNFVFTIVDPQYNFDAQYNNGQTLLLIMNGKAQMEDGTIEDRREWKSCGNGWTNAEGGRIARHETGDVLETGQTFKRQTGVAQFAQRLAELGLGQRLREGVGDGRGFYNADVFKGLVLRMKQEEFINPVSGEKRTAAMPVEVISAGSEQPNPGPGAPAPGEAVSAPVATAPDNGAGDPTRVELVRIAAEVKAGGGSHADFMARATAVSGWDRFARELSDPNEGIFAQA
jgi:hypothetical protein